MVRGVNGGTLRVLGKLDLLLDIDGQVKPLEVRAIEGMDHQMILGIDFCKLWKLEIRFAERTWRVDDGEFEEFAGRNADDALVQIESGGISQISDFERERVTRLVKSIVSPPSSTLCHTNLITHSIEVQRAQPVRCAPRRMSPRMLEIAQCEVRKMLVEGVIEPSTSVWCSAPVIVKKSNVNHRFCINFHELNKATRSDTYPTLSFDSNLYRLRDARYIRKIDLQ